MQVQGRSETAPILANAGDHLALYTQEDWEAKERDLARMSEFEPDVQDYLRFMVGGATDCPIDNNGRILIPAYLRERVGLKGKVVLAGVLDRIEIWDPARYEEKEAMTQLRLPEIHRSLHRLRNGGGD